ncbi:MAG: class I tRNA ligase family protein [Chthoniobacterales bacterium]
MSSERRKPYPFDQFEPKWQRLWDERQLFRAPNPGEENFDPAKPKFYVLDMFPYPSGAGLHVGHPEGYTATDIVARYKRMRGFNVLHPMGWDAFGLPAEQYAIKTGQHPAVTTRENIARFKSQLKRIGFSYDWTREINTTDPDYYKWTQWIFLKIYNSWFNPETKKAEPISTYRGDDPASVRLAYVADVPVNWCPELGTVLANEEVIDGRSEVGGFPVVRRPMRQWMLRITAYAERLIDELEGLDWPEGIKLLQRNWIGRSEGAEIAFQVADRDAARAECDIRVYTTRPDTLYGATYMVLAPEHALVDELTTPERREEVAKYREAVAAKSELERTELTKDKSGIFIGAFAINPANEEKVPIWIADYVLTAYGTGAIMGVPGHDERDLEFARKFGLPIIPVVQAAGKTGEESIGSVEEGVAINSPLIDGLPTAEAKKRIIAWLEQRGRGQAGVRYKLRDWLFSRQRYWGEPFPIVWENGKHRALGESELPVTPPPLEDFKPTGTSQPPLAKARDWIRYSDNAARETNTMPQWAGSCWYYLRYCDPRNDARFVGKEAEHYWMEGSGNLLTIVEWERRLTSLLALAKNKRANRKQFITFGVVERAQADRIKSATRQDVAGFRRYIDVFALRHILNKHDSEHETNKQNVPVGFSDLLRIPDIVREPDAIESAGETSLHLPAIRYIKRIGETICYVEEVLLGRRLLAAKTMYKKAATASHAPRGLAHTPETLRRTKQTIAALPRPVNARKPGGVDLYVGGTEHAVLHLLYARFWHKVLFDRGHVSTPEPFQRLVNQGIILGEDNRKMSKRWGNVIDPLDVIAEYGADAFRCYEMFMGPLEQMKPWSMRGVEGVARFLARVWRLIMDENQAGEWELSSRLQEIAPDKAQLKVVHATIKKVTTDIESLSFNTAISQMMVFVNAFTNVATVPVSAMRTLLVLLNPFAPHISSELWEIVGRNFRITPSEITDQPWPEHDESLLVEDEIEMVVQVNGKVREKFLAPIAARDDELKAIALALPKIQELTGGREIRKVVVVPKKLVNVVVN